MLGLTPQRKSVRSIRKGLLQQVGQDTLVGKGLVGIQVSDVVANAVASEENQIDREVWVVQSLVPDPIQGLSQQKLGGAAHPTAVLVGVL